MMVKHPSPFSFAFIFAIAMTLGFSRSAHAVSEKAKSRKPAQSDQERAFCVSDPVDIEKITSAIKANLKNPHKYDGYREILSAETDQALLARLAYAETVATNCATLNTKTLPMIIEAIVTRIRIRKGDVKAVIFQRDQYSSSMNLYKESRYLDFLCPKEADLWTQAFSLAGAFLADKPLRLPPDTTHYYLYKHSDRLTVPDWAGDKSEWPLANFEGADEMKECIRFFRDREWH